MAKLLTQIVVTKARARGRRYEIPDGSSAGGLPGFSLRVGEHGAKSFVLRVRAGGHHRRITIGRVGQITLAEARQRARELVNRAKEGIDPTADRRPARRAPDTVASVVAQYMELHQKRNGLRRVDDVQRMFNSAILPVLGDRTIQAVTRRDVLDLTDAIAARGAGVMANRVLSLLKRLFSWAIERSILEVSPVATMRPPAKERSRERVLTDQELAAVWRASEALGWPHGPIVRLLILTGARRSEVCGMAWSEVDLDKGVWVKPGERTKSGREHQLPLSGAAVELIRALPQIDDAPWVFPASTGRPVAGLSGPKARLDELSGVEAWVYHDIRRSVASGLARLGASDLVVASVLGHARSAILGVTSRYDRHGRDAEQRAALELWAGHVLRQAAGGEAKVVPLRGRA